VKADLGSRSTALASEGERDVLAVYVRVSKVERCLGSGY